MEKQTLQDQIAASLGMSTLTDEQKTQLTEQMFATVMYAVVARCLQDLTPEQEQEADKIAEEKGEQAVLDYLAESNPNFDQIVVEETEALKAKMQDVIGESK